MNVTGLIASYTILCILCHRHPSPHFHPSLVRPISSKSYSFQLPYPFRNKLFEITQLFHYNFSPIRQNQFTSATPLKCEIRQTNVLNQTRQCAFDRETEDKRKPKIARDSLCPQINHFTIHSRRNGRYTYVCQ